MGARIMENCFLGHPFRVHHATIVSGGAPPAYPTVTERRRLQRLPFDEEETEEQKKHKALTIDK